MRTRIPSPNPLIIPMSYVFFLPRHGKCYLVSQTSGAHGFGAPKKFKFCARSDGFGPVYVLTHRDKKDHGITERPRPNFEVIRVAIEQFCQDGPLVADVQAELDPDGALFAGEIINRYGKPMPTRGVPARVPDAGPNAASLAIIFSDFDG